MTPMQLGPKILKRRRRASSKTIELNVRPAASVIPERPAVIITAALVPRAPKSAMIFGTVAGGVATMAKSGVSGKLSTLGYANTPEQALCFGLTGITGPLKPPINKLCITIWPT